MWTPFFDDTFDRIQDRYREEERNRHIEEMARIRANRPSIRHHTWESKTVYEPKPRKPATKPKGDAMRPEDV